MIRSLGRAPALAAPILIAVSLASPAHSAPRAEIWDLVLGASIAQLPPATSFQAFACGSDGGPPGLPLAGWADFRKCAPEADGLREVYFEYDDEAEYVARAHDDFTAGWSAGTVYEHFPVMTSALFDETGRLDGIRLVTDPRPEQRRDNFLHVRPRQEHYLMAGYLLARFDIGRDTCEDSAPSTDEQPVLGMFVKQRCSAERDGVRYEIEAQLTRRPGESDTDPWTGQLTSGHFVSQTRAELRLVTPAEARYPPAP